MLPAGGLLKEEGVEFEEAASLMLDEHSLRLVLLTVGLHLLLSV